MSQANPECDTWLGLAVVVLSFPMGTEGEA